MHILHNYNYIGQDGLAKDLVIMKYMVGNSEYHPAENY